MKVPSFAVHKLRLMFTFLSTDDDNDNTGAMTMVLRTFVTASQILKLTFVMCNINFDIPKRSY